MLDLLRNQLEQLAMAKEAEVRQGGLGGGVGGSTAVE